MLMCSPLQTICKCPLQWLSSSSYGRVQICGLIHSSIYFNLCALYFASVGLVAKFERGLQLLNIKLSVVTFSRLILAPFPLGFTETLSAILPTSLGSLAVAYKCLAFPKHDLLKENCNAKTSWFHMKERSKCWRMICISLELVKPFSSY